MKASPGYNYERGVVDLCCTHHSKPLSKITALKNSQLPHVSGELIGQCTVGTSDSNRKYQLGLFTFVLRDVIYKQIAFSSSPFAQDLDCVLYFFYDYFLMY